MTCTKKEETKKTLDNFYFSTFHGNWQFRLNSHVIIYIFKQTKMHTWFSCQKSDERHGHQQYNDDKYMDDIYIYCTHFCLSDIAALKKETPPK